MFKSYKITQKTLDCLKNEGLENAALLDLAKLEDRMFSNAEALLEQVQKLTHASEILKHETLLIKKSVGYCRLDNVIPNKTAREWIEALIFALIVATVVRTYFFAPFRIPTGSMLPTIQIGDHIFASMYSYGSPVPFTDIKLRPQPIKRGDIIIFPYPNDPSVDYIKRAIGLPGETLEVRNDRVYINGKPLDEPYAYFDPKQRVLMRRLGMETPVNNFGPISIPEGKLFAMGDNRYNSADSRYWGTLDVNTVKGKGQMVYWSHDPRENLLTGYQLDRITRFLK